LTAEAVNVTADPAQIVSAPEVSAIDTDATGCAAAADAPKIKLVTTSKE
jgi:hypothetical protein